VNRQKDGFTVLREAVAMGRKKQGMRKTKRQKFENKERIIN